MQDSAQEKVIELIAALKRIPQEKITLDSKLQELGMDSLDAINLIFELESAFDVSIPDEFTQNIATVRDIVERLTRLLPHAAPGAGTSQ